MAKFDEEKALAVILYLTNKSGHMNLYALLKTIYYADKYHFQQWGRTITGDRFLRQTYGPIPYQIHDMINAVIEDSISQRYLRNSFSIIFDYLIIVPKRLPDLNELSESDIEMLDRSFEERGLASFDELCDEAQTDPAFLYSKKPLMIESDLAEGDAILLEHLRRTQENERFLNS